MRGVVSKFFVSNIPMFLYKGCMFHRNTYYFEQDVQLRKIEATEDKENNISAMKTPVRRSIRKTPAKKKTPGKVNSDLWITTDSDISQFGYF